MPRLHMYVDDMGAYRPTGMPIFVRVNGVPSEFHLGPPLNTLVPVLPNEAGAATMTLEPGRYFVEAHLPSGELSCRTIELGQAEDVTLSLRPANRSRHEWLGIETLLGEVSGELPSESPRTTGGAPADVSVRLIRFGGPRPRFAGAWTAPLGGSFPAPVREDFDDEYRIAAGERPRTQAEVSPPLGHLFSDGEYAKYEVPPHRPQNDDHVFLQADVGRSTVLLALPPSLKPWPLAVTIGPGRGEELRLSLVVADGRTAALIAYLATGQIGAALAVAGVGERVLQFSPTDEPLFVAAKVYLAAGARRQLDELSVWLSHLCRTHPRVPDLWIVRAWLAMHADQDAASEFVQVAMSRGLPYLSSGIRMLLDVLTLMGPESDQARRWHASVRRVARRVLAQQPFTIVRLPQEGILGNTR